MKTVLAADLFCGAGGTSTGLMQACEQIERRVRITAVNHWDRAVETHAANHPKAQHYCEDLTTLDPRKAVPGGKLDLLVASPECTHHSVARGGMPMNDQSRASAWCVLRWCTALRVDRVLIENVPEFETWGPIGSNSRPLKSRRGETFRAFIGGLQSLGYRVDWRVLNAADLGGATTRRRLFIQAARGKLAMKWPERTHEPDPGPNMFGTRQRWRAAREVIDWRMPSQSIFGRKRPLSENTLLRIEAGIKKFCGAMAEPFLVLLRRNADGRSLDLPMPTLTAGGTHVGLCEPFVLSAGGPAVSGRSTSGPMPTVLTRDRLGLCQPFMVNVGGPAGRSRHPRSVDDPMATAIGENHTGLVEPFLMHTTHRGGDRVSNVDSPLPTVTTAKRGEMAVVQPFIVPHRQFDRMDVDDISEPMRTITATNGGCNAVCQPFITPYYANGEAESLEGPMRTITTRDRFGLCQPEGQRLDILFRMLQPHELAAAMGFPNGYKITGNRGEQVRQIGNAVEVNTARELCRAMLEN